MVQDLLKSLSITNADASPVVATNTGAGANGYDKEINDFVTPTAAGLADTTSRYQMVRLPSNAKLKSLKLTSDAALDTNGTPLLSLDVGLYYSDSTTDGSPQALLGTAISVNLFAAILVFTTVFQEVNALKSFAVAKRNQPLWQAAGLASDPGGFFDIVVAVHAGAATASSQPLNAQADYVE